MELKEEPIIIFNGSEKISSNLIEYQLHELNLLFDDFKKVFNLKRVQLNLLINLNPIKFYGNISGLKKDLDHVKINNSFFSYFEQIKKIEKLIRNYGMPDIIEEINDKKQKNMRMLKNDSYDFLVEIWLFEFMSKIKYGANSKKIFNEIGKRKNISSYLKTDIDFVKARIFKEKGFNKILSETNNIELKGNCSNVPLYIKKLKPENEKSLIETIDISSLHSIFLNSLIKAENISYEFENSNNKLVNFQFDVDPTFKKTYMICDFEYFCKKNDDENFCKLKIKKIDKIFVTPTYFARSKE